MNDEGTRWLERFARDVARSYRELYPPRATRAERRAADRNGQLLERAVLAVRRYCREHGYAVGKLITDAGGLAPPELTAWELARWWELSGRKRGVSEGERRAAAVLGTIAEARRRIACREAPGEAVEEALSALLYCLAADAGGFVMALDWRLVSEAYAKKRRESSKGGRRAKRARGIARLARELEREHPRESALRLWRRIPNADRHEPERSVTAGKDVYGVYRAAGEDGEEVAVQVDRTGREQGIKLDAWRKNYVRSKKSKREV